jgi:hypothetical protein
MFEPNSWLASLVPPNTPTYIYATAHPLLVFVVAIIAIAVVRSVWDWLNEQPWGQKLLPRVDLHVLWVGVALFFSHGPLWLIWVYVMWVGGMAAHAKSTECVLAAIAASRRTPSGAEVGPGAT